MPTSVWESFVKIRTLDALTARVARARAELDRLDRLAERLRESSLTAAFSEDQLRNWPLVRIEEAVHEGLIGLVRSKSEQSSTGIPYIRMNHFDLDGRWNEEALTRVQASADELRRYELKPGDVLFNTRNSVELVGKVSIWPDCKPGYIYNNNLLRLRFRKQLLPEFAFWYMMSPPFRAVMEQEKSATTSVAAIYQRSLYRASMPVPPISEQRAICLKTSASFARADRLEAEAARARALLDRLESAILAKAFRGELVPQDPNEEPANILLERIRAQRAASPKLKRNRRISA